MSEPMKRPRTKAIRIDVEGRTFVGLRSKFKKLEKYMLELGFYEDEEPGVPWREVFKDEIQKYGEPGLTLKGSRYKEGMTQAELAEKAGITQYNLSRMENGKRSIGKEMAKRFAKVFKTDYRIFL